MDRPTQEAMEAALALGESCLLGNLCECCNDCAIWVEDVGYTGETDEVARAACLARQAVPVALAMDKFALEAYRNGYADGIEGANDR